MMLAIKLFKRNVLLKSAYRKLMYIAMPEFVLYPKQAVKQLCAELHVNTNFCGEANLFPPREIITNEYSSKEENGMRTSHITDLLKELDLEIKTFNRVKYKDAEMLLHFMEKGLVTDHEKYALLLLEWCSYSMPDVNIHSRISLANAVWKVLRNLGTEIKADHYNVLLRCYAANGYRIPVLKFLDDMGAVIPNNSTYELLLECSCVVGDVEQGSHIIQLMKNKNIPINEAIFNCLILGHARAGDIKSSLFTLETMHAANLLPSSNTYTALLQSYAEMGDIKEMKNIYKETVSKNINLNVSQIMSICRVLALSQHHKIISQFFGLLPEDIKKLSSAVQNTIIELVHLKCEEAALSLMISVRPEASLTSEHSCAFFVYEMCRADIDPPRIINICCSLEKNELYPRALYKAAEASLQLAKPELCLQIFQTLGKNGEVLRAHYFWPLFRQNAKIYGETGILETLKSMQTLGVTPDFHTVLDYVLPVISTNHPETTIEKLKVCGISVRQALTPVAAALLQSRRLLSVLQLCESYPTKIDFEKLLEPLVEVFMVKKSVKPVASFLKVASKHSTNDVAGHFLLELLTVKRTRYTSADIFKLLESFSDAGLPISSCASDAVTQYFTIGGTNSNLYKQVIGLLESITQPEIHISSAEIVHIPHPIYFSMT